MPPCVTQADHQRSSAAPPNGGEVRQWALRLGEAMLSLRQADTPAARDKAFGQVWELVNSSVLSYLHAQARRFPNLALDDLEDVAAQKSLDLALRAESGRWDLSDRHPAETAAFMAKVARNGIVDLLHRQGRHESLKEHLLADGGRPPDASHLPDAMTDPSVSVECHAFVEALKQCVGRLEPRGRVIWFLRVLCDLPTKEIASHPEVHLKPGHVDVLLQRMRQSIRDCMQEKGYAPQDLPPGTFAELWQAFRADEVYRT